jgi:hypothetical protein
MVIWCVGFVCWLTESTDGNMMLGVVCCVIKGTRTRSDYVMNVAFQLHKRYNERTPTHNESIPAVQ